MPTAFAERFEQPVDARGRFTNLDGSMPHGFGAFVRWHLWLVSALWKRLSDRRIARAAPKAAPSVPHDSVLLSAPPGPGEPPRVTWLGHATFLVQLDGLSLLVDPALQRSLGGGVRRKGSPAMPLDRLPTIDAILVSHSHYDHLDLPTIERVGAPVLAGLGLGRWFADRGVIATELGWWSTAMVRGVRVTFVPAQHWSRRTLSDTNRTLWGGFVIEGADATVYHAGDTAWFEGFERIAGRFPRIDAALLPIGAYEPAWFMERQHMNPEQALRAFQVLGASTFIAMHWGTFKLAGEPLDEPSQRLEAERSRTGLPRTRVRVPAIGETIVLERDAEP